MSINRNRIIFHPIQLQFIGRAGPEFLQDFINNRGFVSHQAAIQTSGIKGNDDSTTAVCLTALNMSQNELNVRDVYSMSCKLIASNDAEPDHLHFNGATSVNLGSEERLGEDFLASTVDKISITAMGTIVAKDITEGAVPGAPVSCMLTLKSVDIDPITQCPVVWFTKHQLSPVPTLECARHKWGLGSEVQISGMVVGYDPVAFMWISKVLCLSTCSGRIPPQQPQPNRLNRAVRHREMFRRGAMTANNGNWQQFVRTYNMRNTTRVGYYGANRDRFMGLPGPHAMERKRHRRRNSVV